MGPKDPEETLPPDEGPPTIPAPPMLDDPEFEGFQLGYPVSSSTPAIPGATAGNRPWIELDLEELASEALDEE